MRPLGTELELELELELVLVLGLALGLEMRCEGDWRRTCDMLRGDEVVLPLGSIPMGRDCWMEG